MKVEEAIEFLQTLDGEEEINIGIPAIDKDTDEEFIALFDDIDIEKVDGLAIIFDNDFEDEEEVEEEELEE